MGVFHRARERSPPAAPEEEVDPEGDLLPFYRTRELLSSKKRAHHRQRWTTRDLAVVDLMIARGVSATVNGVRGFFRTRPDLQVSRPDASVALKMRDERQK